MDPTYGINKPLIRVQPSPNVSGGVKAYIAATGWMPLSARSIPYLFSPIHVLESLVRFFVEIVQGKSIQAIHEESVSGGISDIYTSLKPGNPKDKEFAQAHRNYAASIYNSIGEDRINIMPVKTEEDVFDTGLLGKIPEMFKKFYNLGFKQDKNGVFYNEKTGTIFHLVHDTDKGELILSFWGQGNASQLLLDDPISEDFNTTSMKAALSEFFGGIPDSATEAMKLGHILKETTKDSGITPVVIGHSHGGALAQIAAASNGIKGVVFNSRPMGAGIRRVIGQKRIAENAKNIVIFSGQGDWLSRTRVVNFLAVVFERITGIPVPRSVGRGYNLPKSSALYRNKPQFLIQHIDFYGQLCEVAGKT